MIRIPTLSPGAALVECISGCTCEPSVLDGTSAARVSIFKTHAFTVSPHPLCRLRVTVREEPGQVPQQGHKVMLAAIMVVHKE